MNASEPGWTCSLTLCDLTSLLFAGFSVSVGRCWFSRQVWIYWNPPTVCGDITQSFEHLTRDKCWLLLKRDVFTRPDSKGGHLRSFQQRGKMCFSVNHCVADWARRVWIHWRHSWAAEIEDVGGLKSLISYSDVQLPTESNVYSTLYDQTQCAVCVVASYQSILKRQEDENEGLASRISGVLNFTLMVEGLLFVAVLLPPAKKIVAFWLNLVHCQNKCLVRWTLKVLQDPFFFRS